MRFVMVIFTAVLMLIGVASLAAGQFKIRGDDLGWSVAKSPQTGRCYEIADHYQAGYSVGYGYMGMAEVPCSEVGLE